MCRLSVVFGYRGREIIRVKRCLDSLANQTNNNFKVIFVDYGSDTQTADEVRALVMSYPFCQYVYNDTRGRVWNRAHALNTGIRISDADFTMTSDIDLVYSQTFIDDVLANVNLDTELHANAYALPKGFSDWESLNTQNKKRFSSRDVTALGMVQVTPTDTLKEIGAFDEHYRIWGAEDEDLNRRLKKKGLKTKWLDLKNTPVYHQWHPSSGIRTKKRIPKGWQKNLVAYMKENETLVSRNLSHSWGRVLNEESRKAFAYLKTGHSDKRLVLNDLPVLQSINLIYKAFLDLLPGQVMLIECEDLRLENLKKSRLYQVINRFNRISNNWNWPVLLVSDIYYFGMYETTYDYRDMILFFILNNDLEVYDYYIDHHTEELIRVIVCKKEM